jgi:hypothetical protein
MDRCCFDIGLMMIMRLGVSVDDLDAACSRFEEKKVNWKKRLTDGRMKNVAFVLDPDGSVPYLSFACWLIELT